VRKVSLNELKPGDLIAIKWSDAWAAEEIPRNEKDYDIIWVEWGAFLFIRGKIKRHLVMAYNKKPGDIMQWSFTAIPVELILEIHLIQRGFLQKILPGFVERLIRAAHATMPKRLAEIVNEVCGPLEVRWSANLSEVSENA